MLRAAFAVLAVLFGPILIEPIERNLEFFFLIVGLLTAWMMGQFGPALIWAALREPLSFTLAVLVFGAGFRLAHSRLDQLLALIIPPLGTRWICSGLTIILALLAPLITPVVAALVFVEAIALLRLERPIEVTVTVLACFAIGLGAGITPLGMPGIAVVLAALHADFWYLARLLGPFILAGVLLISLAILFLPFGSRHPTHAPVGEESWRFVLLIRPVKMYVFIAGLVALSEALRPSLEAYVARLPGGLLFWLNTFSAVVNNSTLAVVEIGPGLGANQQRAALLGLLISGGMLISGNLPNVVAASRLGITSRQWARIGLAVWLPLMLVCFAVLEWIG